MTNPPGHASVPAAWYPDPADARQLRYWDGMGWTGQMAPNPGPVVEATSSTPRPEQFRRRREYAHTSEPMHIAEPITGSTQFIPAPSTMVDPDYSYVPMLRGTSQSAPLRPAPHTGPTSTPAVWVYVFLPLLAVPFLYIGPWLDTSDTLSLIRAALVGLMVVLLGVFAGLDHAQLQRREVLNAPTGLVGILPLIFVIDRTARIGRSGVSVLLVSLLVQAAVGALIAWRVYPLVS